MPLFFLIDNSIPEFDGPFIFYMLSRCLARCIHGVFCLLNSWRFSTVSYTGVKKILMVYFSATGKNLFAWIPSRRSWKVQEKAKAGGLTGKQNSDQAHLVDWNWWFSCKRGPWPCSNCSGWWLRQPCASNLCFMWSIWSTRCKHRAWSVEMATGSLGGPFGTIWDQTTIAGLVSEPFFLLYFNLKLSFTRAKLKGFFSDEDVHPKGQRNSMSPRGTIPRPSC